MIEYVCDNPTLPENQLLFKFHPERASQTLKKIINNPNKQTPKKHLKSLFLRPRWLRQFMPLKKKQTKNQKETQKNHLVLEIYGTIKLYFINWHPELWKRNDCKQYTKRVVSLN